MEMFWQILKDYQGIIGAIIGAIVGGIVGGIFTFKIMVAINLLGWMKRMGKKFVTAVDEEQLDKRLEKKLIPLKESLEYLKQMVITLVKDRGLTAPEPPSFNQSSTGDKYDDVPF